ncbi:MAG: DegT/DnrJ/EryC1/StrS family aminotransferase [Anaerolineae bacterium]|nr:DegT/DnrJ/EryC1/StrS family aminotransferase [Anaerolineae bacterium]
MQIREIPWTPLGGVYEQDDLDVVMKMVLAQIDRSAGFFRLPEEPTFEKAFAEHEGAQYAAAVNACGTGLDLAMRILGMGAGDEVITTPLTFVATPHCIVGVGAKVVFADIDPQTYNLDPAKAEAKITSRTKAIVPVHMNGIPADIDAFADIAARRSVKIVYDAAHAVGTLYKGRKVGAAGEMSSYSFQSNKNMSTLGEGGMVTTSNPEYHARLQRIKSFGFQYGPVDDVVEWGTNLRMTKLQSAVGMTQLSKVDEINHTRNRYARYLSQQLADVLEIITPFDDGTHFSPYHLYMLRFNDEAVNATRDDFVKILKGKYKVGVTFHYPPLWNFSFYRNLGYGPQDAPIAATVLRQLFNVPVFPRMKMEDMEYIAWAIKESVADLRRG